MVSYRMGGGTDFGVFRGVVGVGFECIRLERGGWGGPRQACLPRLRVFQSFDF